MTKGREGQEKSQECYQVQTSDGVQVGPSTAIQVFAWQDDVNAATDNEWQMSSFCHVLVAGPSCLTETSVSKTCIKKISNCDTGADEDNDLVALVLWKRNWQVHNGRKWTLHLNDLKQSRGTSPKTASMLFKNGMDHMPLL